eukprot:14936533-Heterocapsa_arctica.AAC.1
MCQVEVGVRSAHIADNFCMSPLYVGDDFAVELLLPVLVFDEAPEGYVCFTALIAALPGCRI